MTNRVWNRARLGGALVAAAIASGSSSTTYAGTVNLGSGWQASWDASLDAFVNVALLNSNASTLFISKSAIFTQGPVNGIFPSIPIVFQQTGESTIANIVIENEVVVNSTGSAWNDFHFDLVGGNATFNPTATANSGGPGPIGFAIAPFTTGSFTADNLRLDLAGGSVANGAQWTPGSGANGGQLWINVTSGSAGNFTLFTFKETPTPGPTALAALALGMLMYMPRRRF